MDFNENFLDEGNSSGFLDLDKQKRLNISTLRHKSKIDYEKVDIEKLLKDPNLNGLCKTEKQYYYNCLENKGDCSGNVQNLLFCYSKNRKIIY